MKKRLIIAIAFIILIPLITIITIKLLDIVNFKCIYKEMFNIYCPGCGTTRMLKSLFKFELYKAIRYNPLMFILLIITIIYLLYNLILYLKGKKLYIPSKKIILIITIVLVLYMVLRNIPGLEFLQPIDI